MIFIDKIKEKYYIVIALFPGGAAVAQLAVNQLVVGSNPTLGAKHKAPHFRGVFVFFTRGFFLYNIIISQYI